MTQAITSPNQFTVVGENIHATRVVLRNGRKTVKLEDGSEAIPFTDTSGAQRHLTIPDWFKRTQPYQQGQIKHFMIAMMKGISDDHEEQKEGRAYLHQEIIKQVDAGAQYLDINVDEIHYDLDIQKRAMRWAVDTVQALSPIPPSIDSSNSVIIAEGLAAYDGRAGRPIINSVSPERPETLDMAVSTDARVIIMATSVSGMPQDSNERVENAIALVDQVVERGISVKDIFIDAIIFPISVDGQNGNHYFETVRRLREKYGDEIHIGMGLSNVSFGMPERKLINQVFIRLAIDAGIDAGLIDPVQTSLDAVFALKTESVRAQYASDMLLGKDEFCINYIAAYRNGDLA
jgi:5-methyltetrahydrofolate--homocysteine methyltransferase